MLLGDDEEMAAASEAILHTRLRAVKAQMALDRSEFRAREAALIRLARSAGVGGGGSELLGPPRDDRGEWYDTSTTVGGFLSAALRRESDRLHPDLHGWAARQTERALTHGLTPEERAREIYRLGYAQQQTSAQLDALANQLISANISTDRAIAFERERQAEFAKAVALAQGGWG
ncbi:hypothetical protein T492DRAFT_844603 [Pavlovales sp. CCMP2436]|nr:hypothetical protein T492DRAFT_844603 [Pavlovales sp. CCMP2436]